MSEALSAALLPLVIGLPLLWALLSMFWRQCASFAPTSVAVVLQLAASMLLWWRVRSGGHFTHELGAWPEPLGIALRVDGLAVSFVLLTALVAAPCALHAHLYLADRLQLQRYFWPLLWFLWAGLNGIWLAADLFNLYVGLELVTLCAVGLVAITGEAEALSAALRYLFAALLGSLSYLLGVALLYGAFDTLSLSLLAAQAQAGATLAVAIALMVAGLLVKTALFPLHGWLPPAHGGALSPVSALLSALVVKSSFYILLRLWMELGDTFDGRTVANGLGLLGTLAIVWGSWKALHEEALKRVVAYSTVAQLGYFFLYFPLSHAVPVAASQLALEGTVLLIASHALAKAAMFLAAGNLIVLLGQDRVAGLAGISRHRPLSLFSLGLASITLIGLPPSGGFSAKWLLLQSALASGHWPWIAVLLLGGLASATYIFRLFRLSFQQGRQEDPFYPLSRWLDLAPMALAVGSVFLGLGAAIPLQLLSPVFTAGVAP